MKKFTCIFLSLFSVAILGCSSTYEIIKESEQTNKLDKYEVLNVGWLDLNEEKWQDYGYSEKSKWLTTINTMNKQSMPNYLNKALSNKKATVVASKNTEPEKEGLVIRFSDVEYVQRTSTAAKILFGAMAGSDTLDLTVHFLDGKTAKELYQVKLSVNSKAAMDASGWGFEGRINNCVYNLAQYISEKVQ